MRKVESINESSLAYPFSLIFKNMGFETIVQIYHVNRLDFAHLFYRNGITPWSSFQKLKKFFQKNVDKYKRCEVIT